jgi:hypothetical protein
LKEPIAYDEQLADDVKRLELVLPLTPRSDDQRDKLEFIEEEEFRRNHIPLLQKPLASPIHDITLATLVRPKILEEVEDEGSHYHGSNLSGETPSPQSKDSGISNPEGCISTIHLDNYKPNQAIQDPSLGSMEQVSSINVSPQQIVNPSKTRVFPRRVNLIEEARLESKNLESQSEGNSRHPLTRKLVNFSPENL